jgi:hypothetical protein
MYPAPPVTKMVGSVCTVIPLVTFKDNCFLLSDDRHPTQDKFFQVSADFG